MVDIRVVQDPGSSVGIDLHSFLKTAALDSLRTLAQRGIRANQHLILAVGDDDQILGCTSYISDTVHPFAGFRQAREEIAGTLLCSTEVAAGHRGRGIGSRLYQERLRIVGRSAPLVLEILGTGTAGSVDRLASRGLKWHVDRGFRVMGHSLECDHGLVLARLD